jgi:hypothetical protein
VTRKSDGGGRALPRAPQVAVELGLFLCRAGRSVVPAARVIVTDLSHVASDSAAGCIGGICQGHVGRVLLGGLLVRAAAAGSKLLGSGAIGQRSGPGFATGQTNSAWSLAQRTKDAGIESSTLGA